jgi:hypothetical protein
MAFRCDGRRIYRMGVAGARLNGKYLSNEILISRVRYLVHAPMQLVRKRGSTNLIGDATDPDCRKAAQLTRPIKNRNGVKGGPRRPCTKHGRPKRASMAFAKGGSAVPPGSAGAREVAPRPIPEDAEKDIVP